MRASPLIQSEETAVLNDISLAGTANDTAARTALSLGFALDLRPDPDNEGKWSVVAHH